MANTKALASGLLMGAGLMYLLDRRQGKRRRARLRDKVRHRVHEVEHVLDQSTRDFRNRAHGLVAETQKRLRTEYVDDTRLRERVRSALGRIVSHPGTLNVTVQDGRVTLRGPVLNSERRRVIAGVRRVRGVDDVIDQLDVHAVSENIPALQGGVRREACFEFMQENWTPAARVLAATLGSAAAVYGMRRRGVTGKAARMGGLALLTRAVTNMPARRLVGADRSAVVIEKSINIDVPAEDVYRFWSEFENFPRFMSHLREVRRTGDRLSHWVAAGPAGSSLEWNAMITEDVPNQRISWKSLSDAAVATEGTVRFLPRPDGGTRVDVRMSYNPPAGALGHAIASFLGADPKHAMDDDLVRLKSLLENGRANREN
jgi:uncharacterized membrane protein